MFFLFSNIIIRLEKHFRVEENMLAYNLPSNVVSLSKYISTTTMHLSLIHISIALFFQIVYIVAALALGHNGIVNGKGEWMPIYPTIIACARHHQKRAVDGEWAHWQLQLIGQ